MNGIQFLRYIIVSMCMLVVAVSVRAQSWKGVEQPVHLMSLEEALKRQKEVPKKMVIWFYKKQCEPCAEMMRRTFGDAQLSYELNRDYYVVPFDLEDQKTYQFKGKTHGPGQPAHELVMEMFATDVSQLAVPSAAFLDKGLIHQSTFTMNVAPSPEEFEVGYLGLSYDNPEYLVRSSYLKKHPLKNEPRIEKRVEMPTKDLFIKWANMSEAEWEREAKRMGMELESEEEGTKTYGFYHGWLFYKVSRSEQDNRFTMDITVGKKGLLGLKDKLRVEKFRKQKLELLKSLEGDLYTTRTNDTPMHIYLLERNGERYQVSHPYEFSAEFSNEDVEYLYISVNW